MYLTPSRHGNQLKHITAYMTKVRCFQTFPPYVGKIGHQKVTGFLRKRCSRRQTACFSRWCEVTVMTPFATKGVSSCSPTEGDWKIYSVPRGCLSVQNVLQSLRTSLTLHSTHQSHHAIHKATLPMKRAKMWSHLCTWNAFLTYYLSEQSSPKPK